MQKIKHIMFALIAAIVISGTIIGMASIIIALIPSSNKPCMEQMPHGISCLPDTIWHQRRLLYSWDSCSCTGSKEPLELKHTWKIKKP